MALIQCRECGEMISDQAKSCPKCGCPVKEKKKISVEQGIIIVLSLIVGVLLLFVFMLVGSGQKATEMNVASPAVGTPQESAAGATQPEQEAVQPEQEAVQPEQEAAQPEQEETTGGHLTVTETGGVILNNIGAEPQPVNLQGETGAVEEGQGSSAVQDTAGEAVSESVQEEAQTFTWKGDAAYDFSTTLSNGERFTLSNQAGNVVFISFWATWCGYCVEETPALQQLYNEYAGKGVKFLIVDCGDSASSVSDYMSGNGYTIPYSMDDSIQSAYGVDGIPAAFVFAKDGTLYQSLSGSAGKGQYARLKEAIDGALAQ